MAHRKGWGMATWRVRLGWSGGRPRGTTAATPTTHTRHAPTHTPDSITPHHSAPSGHRLTAPKHSHQRVPSSFAAKSIHALPPSLSDEPWLTWCVGVSVGGGAGGSVLVLPFFFLVLPPTHTHTHALITRPFPSHLGTRGSATRKGLATCVLPDLWWRWGGSGPPP